MVGSLWGTDSYFRTGNGSGFSGTESHFGTGGDGTVLQWQDTEYQADAQLYGNDDCISIETADMGPEFPSWNTSGDNVPEWTPKQFEANAQLIAWLCKTHDIPCRLAPNTYDSTKGIVYHRMGVDPYRDHGELYSHSFGKVCPGNKRIAQIPALIKRANDILNGDDLPYRDWPRADRDKLVDDVADAVHNRRVQVGTDTEPLGLAVGRTRAKTLSLAEDTAREVREPWVQVGADREPLELAVGRSRSATKQMVNDGVELKPEVIAAIAAAVVELLKADEDEPEAAE